MKPGRGWGRFLDVAYFLLAARFIPPAAIRLLLAAQGLPTDSFAVLAFVAVHLYFAIALLAAIVAGLVVLFWALWRRDVTPGIVTVRAVRLLIFGPR